MPALTRNRRAPRAATALQAATQNIRRVVSAALPGVTGITISSSYGFDFPHQIGTVQSLVTYPEGTEYAAIAARLEAEGCKVTASPTAMTVVRAR